MIARSSYRVYRFISSLRYWAGRRFTKAGFLVLAGVVLTGGLGVDTEQALSYQMFALLICLLLVSMVSTAFFRGRFAARRLLPRFGTVNEPLSYRVTVQNRTARPQAGLVLIENLADARMSYSEFRENLRPTRGSRSFRLSPSQPRRRPALIKEAPLPRLLPHGEAEVRIELMPLRRGALRFTGLTVARPDPFGLFRAFSEVPAPETVLILPHRYPLPPIALPGTLKYQQGGVALASSVGESEEFVSLRDYRRGDPLRHIHWKSWAKIGRPIVKEFQDEFFVRHALILDTFAEAMNPVVFEEAVSVAASFVCTIRTQESLLDLMFVGPEAFCCTAGRGLAHTDQMLEILASVQVCRNKQFESLSDLVTDHITGLSGCICILLDWDEPRRELVRQLKAFGLPMLILLVTADAKALPTDRPAADAVEDFHVLEVGKVEAGLQQLGAA